MPKPPSAFDVLKSDKRAAAKKKPSSSSKKRKSPHPAPPTRTSTLNPSNSKTLATPDSSSPPETPTLQNPAKPNKIRNVSSEKIAELKERVPQMMKKPSEFDSLDLVPIGAFHGRGKRTGVYGAFLLACYDNNNEEFQSICKIGTGFSEEMLEERSASLRSKVIPKTKPYYRYAETINPDVWFETSEVWEVKAADLTISPVHRAAVGIVDRDKGISLRFPRLVRVRPDKSPEEATSFERVAEMYNDQKHITPTTQYDSEDV